MGAELFRTQAYFYGRSKRASDTRPAKAWSARSFSGRTARRRRRPGNELDCEKINATCRLQNNVWRGKGTQSAQVTAPAFDICSDYHTYAFEWTPDYIAFFIDGSQIRRVTGALVTEYTQNASQGMAIHFNVWAGDSSFGGTLNPSILPVRQYISWVQYSSYANGRVPDAVARGVQRFVGAGGWDTGTWGSPFNLSTHSRANVSFVNGIAVLSMTADNATGFTGTPPADTSGGGGTGGTGGAGGTGGSSGAAGAGTGGAGRGGAGGGAGTSGGGGRGGTGGTASPGSGGTSSTGRGGTGAGGTAGSGAGGVGGGGTAGSGAAGTGGGGAGGVAAGSGGTGGPLGSGGASGTGGGSATGQGGAAATGGNQGTGGTPSGDAGPPTGSDTGCGCGAAGDGPTGGGGLIAVLLIAACARRRKPPIATRPSHA
jgi:hypothetical protein